MHRISKTWEQIKTLERITLKQPQIGNKFVDLGKYHEHARRFNAQQESYKSIDHQKININNNHNLR